VAHMIKPRGRGDPKTEWWMAHPSGNLS